MPLNTKRRTSKHRNKKTKRGGTKTNKNVEKDPVYRKSYEITKMNTEMQKRFRNSVIAETTIAKLLMDMNHPNIVRFFDVNENYIDMEELDMVFDDLYDTTKRNKIIETMKTVKDYLLKNL